MNDDRPQKSPSRWNPVDTTAYDAKWAQMAKAGHSPHGEADFVQRFAPQRVLDAGCGTGRVAIELAARGIHTVGADVDEPMITAARQKAPDLAWHLADLVTLDLHETFDVVVMAGNVMIFLAAGSEAQVVAQMARHLGTQGLLIAGFQLHRGLTIDAYDAQCGAAGLFLHERWSTWSGDAFTDQADYAVSVHRRL